MVVKLLWTLRVPLVDTSHFFDGAEDIFAVSFVFLPLWFVAKGSIGFLRSGVP